MELGLKDKKVLITGGADGIGLATAECFAEEGAKVLITSRSEEKARSACSKINAKSMNSCEYVICDATTPDGILIIKSRIQKKWGKLDILIPNIGCGKPISTNPLDDREWREMFEINTLSVVSIIDMLQECINQREASVVIISSIVGRQVFGKSYAYAACKNSLVVLCKYLSRDYLNRKMRVNCVMPGNVYFKGGRWEEILRERGEMVIEEIRNSVPMNRFSTPKEIADTIVFLASERASFINGESIAIDGGQISSIV